MVQGVPTESSQPVQTLESPVAEPVKTFNGQTVLSDGFRTVGLKEFHHIKIADGSTYDLDDAEYKNKVIVQK